MIKYKFWESLDMKRIARGDLTPRCDRCRKRTEKRGEPRLFLLPVFQDKDYTASAEYYSKVCYPISHVNDIPVGRRACRMWPLECPECGARAVLVVDFLLVRGQEVTEKLEVCDYAPLADLLNGTNVDTASTASPAQTFGYDEVHMRNRR